MEKIVFTADFATKKKGDEWECESQLASHLVHHDQVAKYADGRKVELGEKFVEETTENVATDEATDEAATPTKKDKKK